MKLRLSDWASTAEIVSSIAVLATLIFLVVEVRTNTATLQRQVDLDQAARDTQMMDSPYLPGIIAKIKQVDVGTIEPAVQAFMDRYGLTFEEADRFSRFLRQNWLGYQADFYFGETGIDEEIRGILMNPDQALWWENSKFYFDDEFIRHVDQLPPGEGF